MIGIEIIDTAVHAKSVRKPFYEDTLRITHKLNRTASMLRFSPLKIKELEGYKTASLARNTLTKDICLVLFKDERGNHVLRIDRSMSSPVKLCYPVIQGQKLVETIFDIFGIEKTDRKVDFTISKNISNSDDCIVYQITLKK